jgi:peptide methionine sulfoxide reductase msrA/msrB
MKRAGFLMLGLLVALVLVIAGLACEPSSAVAGDRSGGPEETRMGWKILDPDEEQVIVHKGTERPFSGKYWQNHEPGTYTCRRCGSSLFPSSSKFDSGTGWPSFDQALPGAVKEVHDADGARTEIVCARCGAHLGHVFRGEGFTAADTRHCVNSISLGFTAAGRDGIPGGEATLAGPVVSPAATTSAGTCAPGGGFGPAVKEDAVAYFAGGCFWGIEYWFDRARGVILAESGYMGGHTDNPTYENVCAHDSGHIETVRVVYDSTKTTYEELAKLFFEIHDPTQVDRQGPDVGQQYSSVVFYSDDKQKRVAEALVERLRRRGLAVATSLRPAATFWRAEEYHQDFLVRNHREGQCHSKVNRFGDE